MDDWLGRLEGLAELGLVPLIVAALWVLSRVKVALETRWERPGTEAETGAGESRAEAAMREVRRDHRPIVPR